jgi:hypothetical protein
MEEEKRFIFNLHRLSSNVNSISIDIMMEILEYINKNSIIEAQFIEEGYFSAVTENNDFDFFSIPDFIFCVKDAIKTNDIDFFGKLRIIHRWGRNMFRNEQMKQEIVMLIQKRKKQMEEKIVYNTIQSIH